MTTVYAVALGVTLVVSDEGLLPLFATPTDAKNFVRRRLPAADRPRVKIVPLSRGQIETLSRHNDLAKCDYRGCTDQGERLEFTLTPEETR